MVPTTVSLLGFPPPCHFSVTDPPDDHIVIAKLPRSTSLSRLFIVHRIRHNKPWSLSHACWAREAPDPYDALYDVIMTRKGIDGKTYGQNSAVPLLWNESSYLLDDDTYPRFIEAISDQGEPVMSPLAYAVQMRAYLGDDSEDPRLFKHAIAVSTAVAKKQNYTWGLLEGLWRNEDCGLALPMQATGRWTRPAANWRRRQTAYARH